MSTACCLGFSAPQEDCTKPRQTLQSPEKIIESPDRKYKAPTDSTKPPKDYRNTSIFRQNLKVLDKYLKYVRRVTNNNMFNIKYQICNMENTTYLKNLPLLTNGY